MFASIFSLQLNLPMDDRHFGYITKIKHWNFQIGSQKYRIIYFHI